MRCARAEDAKAAHAALPALVDLFAELAVEPNPIAVKALMAAAGQIQPGLRLPLLPSERDPEQRAAQAARFLEAERTARG